MATKLKESIITMTPFADLRRYAVETQPAAANSTKSIPLCDEVFGDCVKLLYGNAPKCYVLTLHYLFSRVFN